MNIEKLFNKAREYHQSGQTEEAEVLYKKILKKKPERNDALLFLGILYYEIRQYDSAIQYLKKSIRTDPRSADAYYNLANTLAEKGLTDEAVLNYQKAIENNPRFLHAYNNLGITFHENKRYDEAVSCFKKAIELDPRLADAHYNLGTVFQDMKDFDKALSSYQRAIHLNPGNADAFFNMGVVFEKKGMIEEAIGQYERSRQLKPLREDVYLKLGSIFRKKGNFDDSLSLLLRALQLNPKNCDTLISIGVVLRNKGNLKESTVFLEKALAIKPDSFEAYNSLGIVLSDRGLFEDAINSFQRATELNPDFAEAYNNLGNVYRSQGFVRKAAECYEKAIFKNPLLTESLNNLGIALEETGNLEEAEARYRQALSLQPGMHTALSNLLLLLNYNEKYDADTIYSEHIKFGNIFAEPLAGSARPKIYDRSPEHRLRIGYVSPDFRQHSVAYFIEPVLANHNPDVFEIFCYSDVLSPDRVTERIRQYNIRWNNIAGMTNRQVADLITGDKIDILIDLAGHTCPERILLFTLKPAPIQINWIGYPNTTGLTAIDYKIVDHFTDPEGMTEKFYSEKLIRMPESFLCYLPVADSPDIQGGPASENGFITFGSFNKYSKISSGAISLWAEILKTIPDAHLVMKARSFADTLTRKDILGRFVSEGISPDRIKALPPLPSTIEHLSVYNEIDICLDTFPYNGTTTTCEALWMGVPVITLAGNTHASRVGVSLLSNTGLGEFIAKTPEEYIEIAVNLANNPERLFNLRSGLREIICRSPLANAKQFVLNLEKCYCEAWKKWTSGLS